MKHKRYIALILLTLVPTLRHLSSSKQINVHHVTSVLAQSDNKVMICHATDSHSNPYITNYPDKSGDVGGHDIHDGPIWYQGICDHCWGDIIPPFEYGEGQNYPGQNWDGSGQAIWENNCNMPSPTSTPTPTSIVPTSPPTPTPTSISIPTPTDSPVATSTPTVVAEPSVTPTQIVAPTTPPNVGGDPSDNNPPQCTDPRPGQPVGLSVAWISSTQVRLTWNHAVGPHTSYLVAYGTDSQNFPWGNPDVGNSNTYTVGSLVRGQRYCFYVQAQNGCSPGDRSEVVCTATSSSGTVLGTSTDNYNPLVDGLSLSYAGSVLGATTLVKTGATDTLSLDSQKLPSNNDLIDGAYISIPDIQLNTNIYQAKMIGHDLLVGDREVLVTNYNGSRLYYGHNQMSIFGRLHQLKEGSLVTLTQGNQPTSYYVTKVSLIADTDIASLPTLPEDHAYLLTCSYKQPSKRWLVVIKRD